MTDRGAHRALRGGAILVYIFLYFPMAVVVLFSLVSNTTNSLPIHGFTFEWYRQLIHDPDIIGALRNSLLVASMAVTIAVTLGVPGALLVDRYDFPGKSLFRRFVLLPLILPGVVTGVSFLTFFSWLHIPLSLWTVILAHGTALISTVVTTVYARLLRIDRSVEEASMDLGVGRWRTFWHVTLPSIRTAVIAAGLLAFTLSMDEIPVTFFIIGRDNTLPMEIWSMLRRGYSPKINAISTIILIAGIGAVTLFAYLTEERTIGQPSRAAEIGGEGQ